MNQNALDTDIFFEITLRRIKLMWDDTQLTERWAIDEKKKEGRYNTSSPIAFSNILYTNPDKITFFKTIFVIFSFSNELIEEY